MASFVARIQLHGAGEKEYRTLQAEMKKERFTAAKKYSAKVKDIFAWTDEYSREGNMSLQEINASVFRAVQKIGKKYSFTTIRNRDK